MALHRVPLLFVLGLALLSVPILLQPGRYLADTHDTLWFAPGWYLRHSLSVWQDSAFLRGQPSLAPMAAFVWALRSLGFSLWLVQRLWYGVLMATAGVGAALLVHQLHPRLPSIGALAAGLFYAITPYALAYGLLFSPAFVPYALLPVLLLVTARWLPRRGLTGPALFGLVVFAMGGGNGAPQLLVLLTVGAYVVWVVGVERTVGVRRALAFVVPALAFAAAMSAYWIFSGSPKEAANALAYSEQPSVINSASSYAESIRGLGFWQFYGGDAYGPWIPAVRSFVTSPGLVLAGFILPVAAVATAWLSRWRTRLLFLFLALGSVVWMAGIFPVGTSTPFGRSLSFAYRHIHLVAGLRTTYKVGMVLELCLALLAGIGLGELWSRLEARPGARRWRGAAAAAAAVVILAAASPVWTGSYAAPRSARAIPDYWKDALRFEQGRSMDHRTFFAPGTLFPVYRWGGLMEGVGQSAPQISPVSAWPFPVDYHYETNLLAAVERSYQNGFHARRTADLLRYLGVRDVVLQNDLDWQRSETARPADVERLARDRSLEPVTSFGPVGRYTAVSGSGSPVDAQLRAERGLPPVQVLAVPEPRPVTRAESGAPIVVSGDGYGLATLAGLGYLEGSPPVLYSGALDPMTLRTLAADRPIFVVTDSNRRAARDFSTARGDHGYTLAPEEGGAATGYGLFGDRLHAQSVAAFDGVRSVTASPSAPPFGGQAAFAPSNAFDEDPRTWWLVGAFGDPVGSWVQVTFDRPRSLSSVHLGVPPLELGRRVSAARLSFSDGSSVLVPVGPSGATATFSPRVSTSLRVEIAGVQGPDPTGVGFTDISIPGVVARRMVRVPDDLTRMARDPAVLAMMASSDLAFVFERARSGSQFLPDEEQGILRRFDVPVSRTFSLSGVARLDRGAPDEEIDRLVRGPGPVSASSSSRFLDDPALRASAALDGNPDTAWVPAGTVGQWIRVTFPRRRLDRFGMEAQSMPGRTPISQIRVAFPDGSSFTRPVPPNGRLEVRFAARATSSVTIAVTGVAYAGQGPPPPVGIAEVRIPGVSIPAAPRRAAAPCMAGPAFTIDGRPVPIRLQGSIGALLDGRQLKLSACRDALALGPGRHDLVAAGALQPDTLVLASRGTAPRPAISGPPATSVHARPDGGYDIDVAGAAAPFYLVTGQDWDPGWTATIQGTSLGRPIILDGYAAGWRVDRAGSYLTRIRYKPQRRYEAALALSAAAFLIAIAIVGWSRRPRRKA